MDEDLIDVTKEIYQGPDRHYYQVVVEATSITVDESCILEQGTILVIKDLSDGEISTISQEDFNKYFISDFYEE